MHHQKSDMKSLVTCKKEELLDQLLSSIEEEIWDSQDFSRQRPLWVIVTHYGRDSWKERRPMTPQEKIHLMRPFRKDESPRIIDPGACRDWAIESEDNWMRIIPEGKDLLLESAQKHNDTQFLEAVKKFESKGRK